MFNFGNQDLGDSLFRIDVGGYNPLLGKSYGEIAAESRSQHKSQGFGVPAGRGRAYEYFSVLAGDIPVNDLMDGIDITWNRTRNPEVSNQIKSLVKDFDHQQPEKIIPALRNVWSYLNNHINNSYWVIQKIRDITGLIKASSGFYMEAVANQQFAVTGDSIRVTFNAINRAKLPVRNLRVSFDDTTFTLFDTLPFNELKTFTFTRLVRNSSLVDQPYWLREQMLEGRFAVSNQQLIGLPQNNKDQVRAWVVIDSANIRFDMPLQFKFTDPVKGEMYQPVITVPQMLVNLSPGVVLTKVIPAVKPKIEVRYQSQVNGPALKGDMVFTNNGSVIARKPLSFERIRNHTETISVPLDSIMPTKKNTELSVGLELQGPNSKETYGNHIRLINYDHIPTVHYIYQSKIKVVNEEIRVVGKRVGYIKGAGDNVPDALLAMGYDLVILDEEDIIPERLKSLDAIITGVRAYNVQNYLADKYGILMEYVKEGGNLIVQYNTSNFISTIKSKIGPFPFTITRNRVTEEQSKVTFLNPNHQVLNFPNKISDKDFENWTQERGVYFADQLDPQYETVLSMNDPGEAAQKGSLIIANYGKGKFVYTGLVFFRQLPAGIAGAYRLLANIIALNKQKGF